ncbi:MAG TPA: helix-turn-helix transcriptional regulator [Gallionella sp.]|nr:helix-turn-helix transcriptional regulator [Gallionella sp.]
MASAKGNQSNKLGIALGTNIAERRKKLGWTQAELAERIGVDTETVSRFERGSNLPSLQRLEKLADALKLPLYRLVAASSPRADDQALILNEWISELTPKDREFALNTLKQLCIHLASSNKKTRT